MRQIAAITVSFLSHFLIEVQYTTPSPLQTEEESSSQDLESSLQKRLEPFENLSLLALFTFHKYPKKEVAKRKEKNHRKSTILFSMNSDSKASLGSKSRNRNVVILSISAPVS